MGLHRYGRDLRPVIFCRPFFGQSRRRREPGRVRGALNRLPIQYLELDRAPTVVSLICGTKADRIVPPATLPPCRTPTDSLVVVEPSVIHSLRCCFSPHAFAAAAPGSPAHHKLKRGIPLPHRFETSVLPSHQRDLGHGNLSRRDATPGLKMLGLERATARSFRRTRNGFQVLRLNGEPAAIA